MRAHCSLCGRDVGVHETWVRKEAGQPVELRLTRHATIAGKTPRGVRKPICPGGGITITPELVTA